MIDTNKRVAIIATDLSTYNIARIETKRNGYRCIKADSATDKDGIVWYRSIFVRVEDMRYKIFGI